MIPGINDDDGFREEADALLGGFAGIREVKRLPFNPYARSKYEAVGRTVDPLLQGAFT